MGRFLSEIARSSNEHERLMRLFKKQAEDKENIPYGYTTFGCPDSSPIFETLRGGSKMKMGKRVEETISEKLRQILEGLGFGVERNVRLSTTGQEVDILLYHKNLGVWLVSVKSYMKKKKISMWLNEIHRARDEFLDYLNDIGLRKKVWVGALLALPRTSKAEYVKAFEVPEEYDNVLILFKEDFGDVDRLKRKFLNRISKEAGLGRVNWNSVLGFFGLVPKRMDINPQKYVCFLDDVQAEIVNALGGIGFGYKVVRGGAGTGKTWLILKSLKEVEGRIKGKLKALIMCFNQNLYEFFKKETEKLSLKRLSVDVERLPIRSGNEFPLAKDRLKQILDREYDLIFCDEVQDFHKEAVEEILNACDNVALFCDDAQRIYIQSRWGWEEIEEKYPLSYINLVRVYRSPARAFRAGARIIMMDERLKENYGDYIRNVISSPKTLNTYGKLVLVDRIDDNLVESIASRYPEYTLAVLIPSWRNFEYYFENKKLPVSFSDTYLRSKGLEFDVVFLKDFWDFLESGTLKRTPEFLYTRAYTFLTRGRFLVVLEEPAKEYSPEIVKIYEVIRKEAEKEVPFP